MPLPRTKRKEKTVRLSDRHNAIRKQKRLSNRGISLIVILLIAVTVPIAVVWYGLTYGPTVDFTFGGESDVRRSYQLVAMSPFQPATIDITHVLVRNSGNVDITVVVTVRALNAVISGNYYGPYTDAANIQVHLPAASGYQVVTFYLTLPVQVPTFTIRVSVSRVLDFSSFASLATSTFAPIQLTSPTTLVYANAVTSPYDYELIQHS